MIFKDRFDAAEKLAEKLKKYKEDKNTIILAIPRGALQIGYVLAKELQLPLDVIFTKKIGAPGNPEFAVGAVSLSSYIVESDYPVEQDYIEREVEKIQNLLRQRYESYRGVKRAPILKDKTVILVDDGIATGKTILSAIDLIKKENPKKIVVAVPVGPKETLKEIKKKADELVCISTPEFFYAIGQFFQNFEQVSDEQAIKLLNEANK